MSRNAWSVVALAIVAQLAGCVPETDARTLPPASPPRGECRYFTLDDGSRICLLSEPQGPTIESDLARSSSGVRVEPLIDANFVGPLEARYDLRERTLNGCLQVRNQGECGWCVGNAVGAALDALYCSEGCPPGRVSMPHLWAQGHGGAIEDCGYGWWVDDGLRAATSGLLVPESDWPFAGGSRAMNDTRPTDAELVSGGRYRATGYATIADDDQLLDRIERVISSGRAVPVWSGICWTEGWSSGETLIDAPMGNCASDGMSQYDGYHAYTIVGYDHTAREFIALNSWGDGWGNGGYMRLSYDFVDQEVRGGGYLEQIDRTGGGCTMDEPDGGVRDGAISRDAGVRADGAVAGDAATLPDGGVVPRRIVDRCAAITDCAVCATTSGCVFCDGTCVPSDEAGEAPAVGTCETSIQTTARDCTPESDPCAAHGDCNLCADDARCAWCADRGGFCLSWTSRAAYCPGSRVATADEQCNDVDGTCEAAASCTDCLRLDGCGWCAGASGSLHTTPGSRQCFGGTLEHADRASCSEGWSGPGGMCPMPDAAVGSASDGGVAGGDGSTSVCAVHGGPCALDAECCTGLQCVASACRDPALCGIEGVACTSGAACCGGLSCQPDTFGGARQCCVGFDGGRCDTDADCCGQMTCSGGMCMKRSAGQSCASRNDCSGALDCIGGTCG